MPSRGLPDEPRLTAGTSVTHKLDHAGYAAHHAPEAEHPHVGTLAMFMRAFDRLNGRNPPNDYRGRVR